MCAAIGEEAVSKAAGCTVAHFVAVALVQVLVVEGFGVGECDMRVLAAGNDKQRIGGGERLAIEQQVDVRRRQGQ